MEKKITVLTPNGRRQIVRTTPNTTLLQILEEVCQKHNFSSDEYGLKHHNKEISLSQMFRFSGLPNNCLLEMFQTDKKRLESDVDICIQLENGSRVQGTFNPTNDLWSLLTKVCPEEASSYESPVVIFMRQEIFGKNQLSTTSLRSLGMTSGRAMLRFVDKKPEDLKIQANVYKVPEVKSESESFKSEESRRKFSNNETHKSGGFTITADLVQSLKKTTESTTEINQPKQIDYDQMDTSSENTNSEYEKPKYDWGSGGGHSMLSAKDTESNEPESENEMEIEPEIHYIGERSAILYSLNSTPKSVEDLPDSFYDLTVNDLKLVLRDLKKESCGNENSPLLTTKLRELEESKTMLNKLNQYKNCVIRIQFPDRYVLQGIFKPTDRISDVCDFVRKFLQNEKMKFQLFTIPPKTVMMPDKTLLELCCVPTAVFHFDNIEIDKPSNTETLLLKADVVQNITTPENAVYAAKISRLNGESNAVKTNNELRTTLCNEIARTSNPSSGAIPKRPRNESLDNISK